ncbi:MAG TPA: Crp/Fnr family transcriptional regulator [Rubrobacter sp.]|nr:Crp/Fnr family transcriptional regulator [Rubrobacter sp.]
MPGQYAGATATPRYLSLEDFEREGVRVAERRFGNRDIIFSPGDPGGQLYFLLSGTVRLYKIYGSYKEATVALLKDGGVFGELGLDEGSTQSLFAEALTSVRVAVVRKSTLIVLIKRRPEFAVKLLYSFSDRLEQSGEVLDCLLDRGVAARLCTLLVNLGDRFGEANGSGTIIDVRLTHQDLANMISSTREAVSKEMSELQRNGTIEIRNRRIVLYPQLAKVS